MEVRGLSLRAKGLNCIFKEQRHEIVSCIFYSIDGAIAIYISTTPPLE